MRAALSDEQLDACSMSQDQLAGKIFATPSGRLWLAANENRWPHLVAEIRQRIRRQRLVWGDKGTVE